MATTVPIVLGLVAAAFLALGAILDDRRARYRRRGHPQMEELESALPLLHSINDDRCIGCEACIDVCPTEVLDLVAHKVRVARFSDCVQCEQCANACPTQALVMYREGSIPRMLTVPELDDHFQTAVPGQFLIGEIAGKPLVKNAANLGRAVIEHISRDLRGTRAPSGVVDVVIVGSGPGGLSAGLTCIKRKLSCIVLEKEHIISSTVSRYPKGKHFMAEPATSHNVSFLPVFDGTKEELVAAWQKVALGVKLPIKLGEAVETVARGDDGVFTVKTTVGTYRSRTVVLATGLRGKPRLLAVPGANLEKVQSLLDDPAEFAGQHVLVVGGGDSAVEGAMSLVDVGATVTLSYRGDGFKRCKQGNQKRLAELIQQRKLDVLLESNVSRFTPDAVTIKLASGTETTIPNQQAFVLIGADTPVAWLEANNVRFVERPHLYALGSTDDVVRRYAPDAVECSRSPEDALALLLDRPVHKRRVMSVVGHIRDEFRDIATSVSQAFRLSDLQPSVRTPPRGVPRLPTNKNLVSATRLYAKRPETDFGAPEPTLVGPTPLVPRSPRARTEGSAAGKLPRALDVTTAEITSLRELEKVTTDIEMPSLRTLEHDKATLPHAAIAGDTRATLPQTAIAGTLHAPRTRTPIATDKATLPQPAMRPTPSLASAQRALGLADTAPATALPPEVTPPIVRFKPAAPRPPAPRTTSPSPVLPVAPRAHSPSPSPAPRTTIPSPRPPSPPPAPGVRFDSTVAPLTGVRFDPAARAKPPSGPPPVPPRARPPSPPPFAASPWNAPGTDELDNAFANLGADKMKPARGSQPIATRNDFEDEASTVIVDDDIATVISSALPPR